MSNRKIITLPTDLQALMDRHRNQCEEWREGRPVELFRRDGRHAFGMSRARGGIMTRRPVRGFDG